MSKNPLPANQKAERTIEYRAAHPKGTAGCVLYVCSPTPEDHGKSFRMERGEAVVGRDEDCDLSLLDASVSRHHAKLSIGPEGITVQDLGSTNGTTFLGKRIDRGTFQPGSRIAFGKVEVDLLPLPGSEAVPASDRQSYGALYGASLPMRRLYTLLEMLEKSEAPVLIEGETGTGKELVARALHEQGPRAKNPFVIIDCGNVQTELIESELFGHRKGAFTGAVADRVGAFEAADGGTVFLDELDELPLPLQPALLRVLETGQVKRLGESNHMSVDVRLIAATKRDLKAESEAGRFRADLFYRIAVVHLLLPPLRERREDIPLLIAHLTQVISKGKAQALPPEAQALMMHHDWPGNVRELRNAVHRTLTLGLVDLAAAGQRLSRPQAAGSEPARNGGLLPFREAKDLALDVFERDYLGRLLQQVQGSLAAAARAAGIDRKYLRELLKKHGLYRQE